MISSPIETYTAIKTLILSENALGTISDSVKQSYLNKINTLEKEYQKAGASGSFNAGLETGKLLTETAALLAGGAGLAKGGVTLTEKLTVQVKNVKASEAAKKNQIIENNVTRDDHLPSNQAVWNNEFDRLEKQAATISTANPRQATQPRNLQEQIVWNEVLRNPTLGKDLAHLNSDKRFPQEASFVKKMTANMKNREGKSVEIHYQYNSVKKKFMI